MQTFLTDKVEIPIKAKVFTDYDKLNALALKKGYKSTECVSDETVEDRAFVGMQNSHLHSGWIATMDDSMHKALQQIEHLNAKIVHCKAKGEQVLIGFCRTGNFSVGYTIYVKA